MPTLSSIFGDALNLLELTVCPREKKENKGKAMNLILTCKG